MDGPEAPSEVTAAVRMFDVHCVGLHCHREGSHVTTDQLLGLHRNTWEVADFTVMRK